MVYYKVGLLLILVLPTTAFSGIVVAPTRVIYDAESNAQNIMLKNNSKTTFLTSAKFEGNGQNHFAITPPITRIEAGEKSLLRIRAINTGQLPTNQESVFYYSITMIENDNNLTNKENRVAVASRYWFKLFYRPKKIGTPKNNNCNIEASQKKDQIYLNNNSPFFSTLVFFSVNGKKIRLKPEEAMIAPYSKNSYHFAGNASVIEWIRINDYGGTEEKCIITLSK